MKERPILFSAPMVRALLDGSKTQTRRIMKVQPPSAGYKLATIVSSTVRGETGMSHWDLVTLDEDGFRILDRKQPMFRCPYGQPGDRLWVRETHRPIFGQTCGLIAVDYRADPREKWERLGDALDCLIKGVRWTPSIHMRREYSRISLEITGIRVERLNDISYEDALAEGVNDARKICHPDVPGNETTDACSRRLRWPQREYELLWNQINGAGSWDANPWVWCIEFKRVAA